MIYPIGDTEPLKTNDSFGERFIAMLIGALLDALATYSVVDQQCSWASLILFTPLKKTFNLHFVNLQNPGRNHFGKILLSD